MNAKLSAAAAAILWGFTYVLTTTWLPPHPLFLAAFRALGGALVLLAIVRCVPPRAWWGRLAVLGKVGAVTLRLLPKISDRVKRVLLAQTVVSGVGKVSPCRAYALQARLDFGCSISTQCRMPHLAPSARQLAVIMPMP